MRKTSKNFSFAFVIMLLASHCKSSQESARVLDTSLASETAAKPALQPDYATDSALFYYLSFNFSSCSADTPKVCKNICSLCNTKSCEGTLNYHGWDQTCPEDPAERAKADNPAPQILVQLELLDKLKNSGKNVLIFTDDAKNLIEYWGLSDENRLAPNFSIIQVKSGSGQNSVWARDYLGRPVYSAWPNKGSLIYVDTGYGTGSENTLSRWLAHAGQVPFQNASRQILPGGNILALTTPQKTICYLIEEKGVVDLQFNKNDYGCDESVVLLPTTQLRHVDLTLSIVPTHPIDQKNFKIVMAQPLASSMLKNYEANKKTIEEHIAQNPNLFGPEALVLLPMEDAFAQYLSPTNFIMVPEASKIILSLPERFDPDFDKVTIDKMSQAFPDWTVESISMTHSWKGGLHCMTGQLTNSIFETIKKSLGEHQLGKLDLSQAKDSDPLPPVVPVNYDSL